MHSQELQSKLHSAQNILVTYLMHLGDLVLTTPFIHALRQAAPQAKITMLVDKKLVDIVKYNPHIDQVLTIDKKGKDDSVMALWKYSRQLKDQNYDLLINLHPNERCSFLGAFSGATCKVGATAGVFKPWFDAVYPLHRNIHAVEMYLDVLRWLGVAEPVHEGLEMQISEKELAVAQNFYVSQGVSREDKLIGLNIGSAVETKRWEVEKFAMLADRLATDGYKIVYFGGPMDVEVVERAATLMKHQPIIAAGKFGLAELAAAIANCQVFVTNDSGPMHVAITQKVPVVALYGPSHTKLYGPYTDKAIVVKADPPCTGCKRGMKHHCDHLVCMEKITVEQAYQAVEKMVKD